MELAEQKQEVEIQYRTIEKEVIKYVQKNTIVNDADWLRIRADAVRAHNRASSFQQAPAIPDGAASATPSYVDDTEIFAEDIANLETCADNALKLRNLQIWI